MEDLKWFTSTRSGNGGNSCVEVAFLGHGTAVRDSKDRSGPVLVFGDIEWIAFVKAVKSSRFDRR
jgi:hypothetical protein